MARGIYNSVAWKRIRPYVLARDGYKCQLRLPGCKTVATAVDHIVEYPDGPAFEMSNLQASCGSCNSSKARRRERRRYGEPRRW